MLFLSFDFGFVQPTLSVIHCTLKNKDSEEWLSLLTPCNKGHL